MKPSKADKRRAFDEMGKSLTAFLTAIEGNTIKNPWDGGRKIYDEHGASLISKAAESLEAAISKCEKWWPADWNSWGSADQRSMLKRMAKGHIGMGAIIT